VQESIGTTGHSYCLKGKEEEMDVKGYYRKLKERAAELPEADVAVVSEATQDGGQAGVVTIVPREIACRLLVERRARLANVEEREAFENEQRQARESWIASQKAEQFHLQLIAGLEKAARSRNSRRS